MRKKHVTQMNKVEINICCSKLSKWSIANWKISKHAIERMDQKDIPALMIAQTIMNHTIIEYKIFDNGEERIVIRSKDTYKNQHICLVLNVSKGRIITAWSNHMDDQHGTLDISKYSSQLVVQ